MKDLKIHDYDKIYEFDGPGITAQIIVIYGTVNYLSREQMSAYSGKTKLKKKREN